MSSENLKKRLILAIDEYPYLAKSEKALHLHCRL